MYRKRLLGPWGRPESLNQARGARSVVHDTGQPGGKENTATGIVFAHACKIGLEGIVSKRKDSAYRSGRSPDWLKMKNPAAPAVKREAEEDWGK
jgi:hypothetical protein